MSRKGGKGAVQGKTDRKLFSLSHRKLHAKYLEEELLSFRTRGLKSLQEAQLPWWLACMCMCMRVMLVLMPAFSIFLVPFLLCPPPPFVFLFFTHKKQGLLCFLEKASTK